MKSADSLKDCIYIHDSKTNSLRSALSGSRPASLKGKTESYVFSLPLYVKDYTSMHKNVTNVVHIVDSCTDEEKAFVPGFTPQDLLKSKAA